MVNYERYREGTPRPFTVSVPAPEFLDGDFSKLVDGQGRRITIYNPFTGRDVNGTWTRDAVRGQQDSGEPDQPDRAEDPDATIRRRTQPTPARQLRPGQLLTSPAREAIDADNFYNLVVKIDHNFNDKHRMFFRHAQQRPDAVRP